MAHNRGERNPRAILSDEEVDLMRDLYEADKDKPRDERYWTIARLMEKFELSRRQVFNIVGYHQRVDRDA